MIVLSEEISLTAHPCAFRLFAIHGDEVRKSPPIKRKIIPMKQKLHFHIKDPSQKIIARLNVILVIGFLFSNFIFYFGGSQAMDGRRRIGRSLTNIEDEIRKKMGEKD